MSDIPTIAGARIDRAVFRRAYHESYPQLHFSTNLEDALTCLRYVHGSGKITSWTLSEGTGDVARCTLALPGTTDTVIGIGPTRELAICDALLELCPEKQSPPCTCVLCVPR
jgi:hypothetical protein